MNTQILDMNIDEIDQVDGGCTIDLTGTAAEILADTAECIAELIPELFG